jgi:hypothetical protein
MGNRAGKGMGRSGWVVLAALLATSVAQAADSAVDGIRSPEAGAPAWRQNLGQPPAWQRDLRSSPGAFRSPRDLESGAPVGSRDDRTVREQAEREAEAAKQEAERQKRYREDNQQR